MDFALLKIQGWVIPLSLFLEEILLLISKLDFHLTMENKCCSCLKNRTEKGREQFTQLVSILLWRYFNEIFQFRDTLHRQEEKCTKMKRNLNRSYLLHRRRRFQLIVQYNSAFITNGKRNAWTWKWLVCNISWAVVCTGLSEKYIMYKASNITYSSETPVQYENWVSKGCFKKRGIFSIFFQERRP